MIFFTLKLNLLFRQQSKHPTRTTTIHIVKRTAIIDASNQILLLHKTVLEPESEKLIHKKLHSYV